MGMRAITAVRGEDNIYYVTTVQWQTVPWGTVLSNIAAYQGRSEVNQLTVEDVRTGVEVLSSFFLDVKPGHMGRFASREIPNDGPNDVEDMIDGWLASGDEVAQGMHLGDGAEIEGLLSHGHLQDGVGIVFDTVANRVLFLATDSAEYAWDDLDQLTNDRGTYEVVVKLYDGDYECVGKSWTIDLGDDAAVAQWIDYFVSKMEEDD